MRRIRSAAFALLLGAVLLLVGGSDLLAQQPSGVPSLRPYWHVFIAYAAAWLLILGWLISIARRLARIERTLRE